MRQVSIGGVEVPLLGQGTWHMGESAKRRAQEIAALRAGVELGMTLIDTAEMYGDGATESLVGAALAGLRDQVTLVSKVYPHNAGRSRIERACEDSLRRLATDRLDLYLLHWRGRIPLAETVEGMEALRAVGKIRAWGVSNFDLSDMKALSEAGGQACVTNQILYNITERGSEFDLLPSLNRQATTVMAYSPVGQGQLPTSGALDAVARRHDATVYEIALAWVLRRPGVIAIPKAADRAHVRQNARAGDLVLSGQDIADLDAAFPPPIHKTPLAML